MRSQLPPELARSRWRPTPAERRQLRREREHFAKVRQAEVWYIRQLRMVAQHIGKLAEPFATNLDPAAAAEFDRMMRRYAEILYPWATVTAERMIADVSRRDAHAWFKIAREIGISMQDMLANTPLGYEMRRLMDSQVQLITSLPIEAARDVQTKVMDRWAIGRRIDEIIPDVYDQIQDVRKKTLSRATLIARTETARASSVITTARARYVGVTHFVWRTVGDADVRPLHRTFNNKVYALDDPPELDDGRPGLPGTIYNCRCFLDPIIPLPEV